MFSLKLADAFLIDQSIPDMNGLAYQYLVASDGLYIRAACAAFDACLRIAPADLRGAGELAPYFRFNLPRIPESFLRSVLLSARRNLPNEAMYQFTHDAGIWMVQMPHQSASPGSVTFDDNPAAIVDLHSHNTMHAYFSDFGAGSDNQDEQGLRIYCVIGQVDTNAPEMLCRVGVYGHHMLIPADSIFESTRFFTDLYNDNPAEPTDDTLAAGEYETPGGLYVVKY